LYESFCERVLGGSGLKVLQNLFQQQQGLYEDLVSFSAGSRHEDLGQGLLQVLV
jgi:hypothetical protein